MRSVMITSHSSRLAAFVLTTLISAGIASAADDWKPEPGFKALFNGKDLTGWTYQAKDDLDGKTESPDKRFKVADGVVVIDPKVKGDVKIFSKLEFAGDFHLKFDFFPGEGCNNDLFIRGQKFDLKKEDVKNFKLDEWNSFEIVVKGDKMEFRCNGESLKTVTIKPAATTLGIRAELGPMKLRHVQVKLAA